MVRVATGEDLGVLQHQPLCNALACMLVRVFDSFMHWNSDTNVVSKRRNWFE